MRKLIAFAVAAVLGLTAPAEANGPLGLTDCGPIEDVYQCSGLVETWDGVPLDTTVTLPRKGSRRLPLLVNLHGFGNSKWEYLNPDDRAYSDNAYAWAKAGYAVLTYTSRGLWGSCGTPDARLASPAACASGYLHLADVRFEGRDTQELIGRLVDDRTAHPKKIGVTGDSYGGGQGLMLAALSDRMMLPDGSLVPWRSPAGRPLRLAAAAPVIPWSDLITAAAPNGRVAANRVTPPAAATVPVGVVKLTFVNAIFAAAQTAIGPGQPLGEPFVPGRPMGFLAPGAIDSEADVAGWVARTDLGEPYTDARALSIVDLLVRYHSAYYIDPGSKPPPLLLSSGFTDDLFPVDEVLRYANRSRRLYPKQPLSLLLGDFGHQRAANKPGDRERLLRSIHAWMDRYVKGEKRAVGKPAVAFVQTCPRDEPSIGPISAPSFRKLAPRRLRRSFEGAKTVDAVGGDPAVAQAIEPAAGRGSCAIVPATEAPGTATYELESVERRPLTTIGSLRVEAELDIAGAGPGVAQIASRLWDVAPDGETQRLVARGSYRPRDGANLWHLHPGAWRFEPGHTVKLELLGSDAPYSRPSNALFSIEINELSAALPIR